MRKILNGWKHLSGVHCGSVAIRDVCNYYKHNLTEEMCFGLGGGLGFYYSRNDRMSPTRSIHVRGPSMEANFFNNFGLNLSDWKQEENDEKAFTLLRDFLINDIPVLIQTDIFYLEYYNSNTHFPGHIVVVCGFDDEKELFYLADTSFNELQAVSYEAIKNARSSKAEPYPLSNNFLDIDITGKKIDFEKSIPGAMQRNAMMMKDGFVTSRGKSGVDVIKQWAEDLPGWKNCKDWKWSSRFSYQVISKRGVEGAAFRWFYRDFLKQSVDYLPAIQDLGLIESMDEIGSRWTDISSMLKSISEMDFPGDEFYNVSSLANKIFTLEKQFYESVIENINTG